MLYGLFNGTNVNDLEWAWRLLFLLRVTKCIVWSLCICRASCSSWCYGHASTTTTTTTVLQLSGFCPWLPGWAGTRRTFTHSHLYWSSFILYLLPSSTVILSVASSLIGNLRAWQFLRAQCYASMGICYGNSVCASVHLSLCHMHALHINGCMDRADFLHAGFPRLTLRWLSVF